MDSATILCAKSVSEKELQRGCPDIEDLEMRIAVEKSIRRWVDMNEELIDKGYNGKYALFSNGEFLRAGGMYDLLVYLKERHEREQGFKPSFCYLGFIG